MLLFCISSLLLSPDAFCLWYASVSLFLALGSILHCYNQVADIVLTIVFTVEMFIRIIALGFYDRKVWPPRSHLTSLHHV